MMGSWADAVAKSKDLPTVDKSEPEATPLAFGKPDKWSVRLACGTPERHYTVVTKLKDDAIEWCPRCRTYRPRMDVAPLEKGRRRRRPTPATDSNTPSLFDADPPPPF